MLTGRAALERPRVNALGPRVASLVSRQSSAAAWAPGSVDPVSGAYSAVANRVTEAQRRTAVMRRNGQPRRVARGA